MTKNRGFIAKYILLLVFASILDACGWQKTFEEITKLNEELRKTFRHQDINSTIHFGTDRGDNYIDILFFNFEVNNQTHNQLKSLADSVRQEILSNRSSFSNLESIEVSFTSDSDGEDPRDTVHFRLDIPSK